MPLPGPVQPQPNVPGDLADLQIENVAFRDYWLPLYGEPIDVAGLPEGQWLYDQSSGTGYTGRPRQEDGWQEQALLPVPTVAQLRAAQGTDGVGLEYLDTTGVDPRVGEIAQQAVAGATNNFDRAIALQDYFTAPGSPFTYSLQTAPGAGDDALVEFLTVGRVGYCEQFASAMAVMLRTVGVPARVAVGFTAGVDAGAYRSISTSDAHAWVEAWFPGIGWTAFDPTPLTDGRSIDPPYVQEARSEGPGRGGRAHRGRASPREDVPGQEPPPPPTAPEQLPPDAVSPAAPQSGGLPSLLWPLLVLLLVIAIGAGAGRAAACWTGGGASRPRPRAAPTPPAPAGPSCSPSPPTVASSPRRATPCGPPPGGSCGSTGWSPTHSRRCARWSGRSRRAGTAARTRRRASWTSRYAPWPPGSRRAARCGCGAGCCPRRCCTGCAAAATGSRAARRAPEPERETAAPRD